MTNMKRVKFNIKILNFMNLILINGFENYSFKFYSSHVHTGSVHSISFIYYTLRALHAHIKNCALPAGFSHLRARASIIRSFLLSLFRRTQKRSIRVETLGV